MVRRIKSNWFVLLLALLFLSQPSCEDKRRHGANNGITVEEVSPPVSADAPPGEVANALLAAIGRAQEARAHGLGVPERRNAYEKAMAEILSLTAKKEVAEQMRAGGSANIAKDISDEAALTLTAESWVSLVAHYAKGVMPETLRVLAAGSPAFADVHMTAESPEDKTVLASLQSPSPATSLSSATSQPTLNPPSTLDATARAEALRRGVNPLLRADIQIRLKNIDGRWRATQLSIGPTGMTFLPVTPAKMPAVSTQSSKS